MSYVHLKLNVTSAGIILQVPKVSIHAVSKDSFHDLSAILLPEIISKILCSAGDAGQQVLVVDNVDVDSSDFIH